jgi:hypothetical protein
MFIRRPDAVICCCHNGSCACLLRPPLRIDGVCREQDGSCDGYHGEEATVCLKQGISLVHFAASFITRSNRFPGASPFFSLLVHKHAIYVIRRSILTTPFNCSAGSTMRITHLVHCFFAAAAIAGTRISSSPSSLKPISSAVPGGSTACNGSTPQTISTAAPTYKSFTSSAILTSDVTSKTTVVKSNHLSITETISTLVSTFTTRTACITTIRWSTEDHGQVLQLLRRSPTPILQASLSHQCHGRSIVRSFLATRVAGAQFTRCQTASRQHIPLRQL